MLCRESGSHLAAIHNNIGFVKMRDTYRAEYQALRGGSSARFWVGLQVGRNSSGEKPMWDDGTPLDFLPPGLSQVTVDMAIESGAQSCAAVNSVAEEGGSALGDCEVSAGFVCRGEARPSFAAHKICNQNI